jgi:hypothetical protein
VVLAAPDFKKRPMVVGDICSTMPRLTASAASVFRDHCDKYSGGVSQANAMI